MNREQRRRAAKIARDAKRTAALIQRAEGEGGARLTYGEERELRLLLRGGQFRGWLTSVDPHRVEHALLWDVLETLERRNGIRVTTGFSS